jgi:cell division protein FtsI (penicillin-binding protein 3)
MLEEVVEKGTGVKARVDGFRVAGKTGTAQKVDPVRGGYGDKRLASFLGFLPADDPRLAILVAVDEPEGRDVFGGSVAAPAWSAIAAEGLRQIGVIPHGAREAALVAAAAEPEEDRAAPAPIAPEGRAVVPDVAGLPARTALRRLAEAALEPELRGSGRAVSQSPRAGAVVHRGARVRVTLAPPG